MASTATTPGPTRRRSIPTPTFVGTRLPVLVPARGAEIGVRTTVARHLQSTLSLWCLHNDSELYFNGIDADNGETTASAQATNRYGFEWANYYTPARWLTLDLDYADSRAYFVAPTTAAEDVTPGGTLVDEAIRQSLSAGVTWRGPAGWQASLRLRYFGPRPLTSDGSVTSASTSIVNLGVGWRVNRTWRVSGRGAQPARSARSRHRLLLRVAKLPRARRPGGNEDHFHPVEPLQFRLGFEARL